MRMGVVADDITGSNDIGIMFAKSGCLAYVYNYTGPGSYSRLARRHASPDICILNTNSRLDPAPQAYEKVYAATTELRDAGCRRFFNKTCSVFRGNIGAEFDAMLDALGEDFAVVVLGFPKNGRTTIDGVHYVHGKRLEESEFREDPIHPIDLPPRERIGILCVAGSLMPQTTAQMRHLKEAGTAAYELDTRRLFEPQARLTEIERLVDGIVEKLLLGEDVLFHSPGQPGQVAAALAAGAKDGLSTTETSRLVSETIAEVSALVLGRAGQNRLVVAGGETSDAVCARLGVEDLMIWEEIQPGLPSCFSLSTEPLLLVLKSGSFGTPDFLEQAIEHLKAQ
jgi:uncharacterized protein YgbK (DUF1537 family)